MRFEDLARQSVDALRESAKQSVRPVAELLAPRRQLSVTPLVAATVGLLVLAVVGLPAWLQRRDPPPDPGSDQSSRMFAPPFEIESGVHRYTVQLPNGEWLTLSLPGSIAREVAGFVPGATIGPSPESGHPLEVVYGTVESVFADAELVETLTDATGEPVLRYRAEAGWQSSAVQYGPWVVFSHEEGDVSGAETPLANLSGSVTEDGFLLLTPRAGLSFQPPHSSPDAAFLSASGETLLWLWHPHAGGCEGDEVGRLRLDEGPDITTLCDPATGDALFVANAAGFSRDDMSRIAFHVGPHPTSPTIPPDTTVTTVGGGSEVFRTLSETLPGLGWLAVTLPEQVAYQHEVRVWTDADLVFWGGQTLSIDDVPTGDPGVAYSPDSDTWRELPPSPKPAAVGSAAVWTGSEVIICCGNHRSPGMRVTASYDPITNTWQRREDSPLFGDFASAVWTGSEMLVVVRDGVMGYDPVSDTWRRFADPPALLGRLNATAWTGNEIVIWPRDVQRSVRRGLAMDPELGSWRLLPDPPAWPAVPDIAVTNDSLIIWGGLPGEYVFDSERAVGSRLDLTTNEWVRLPDALPEPEGCECNLGSQTLLWTGRRLLVATGYFASGVSDEPLLLAYHPTEDRWSQVGAADPVHGFDLSSGLMAGDRVVFRGDRLYLSPPGWAPEPR